MAEKKPKSVKAKLLGVFGPKAQLAIARRFPHVPGTPNDQTPQGRLYDATLRMVRERVQAAIEANIEDEDEWKRTCDEIRAKLADDTPDS